MKLRSQEKLKDVQLRVKVDEKVAGLLEHYVIYANTQLGHHFNDAKELAVEVLRAFVEDDRGFKAWREQGAKKQVAPTNGVTHPPSTLTFAEGVGAK